MEKHYFLSKIEEIVKSNGFFLIDLIQRGDSHLKIIEIFIDGQKGITTVDCSSISRQINEVIELENLIESNYRLDVSSPGVDRPLKFIEQFPKHLNRKFEVTFKEGEESKKISGKLVRIEGDQLYFESGKSEFRINFNEIITAKVLISF